MRTANEREKKMWKKSDVAAEKGYSSNFIRNIIFNTGRTEQNKWLLVLIFIPILLYLYILLI